MCSRKKFMEEKTMENNNLMVNENEVMEATEEIAEVSSGNGFKAAAVIGLAVIGGIAAYKFIVKPLVAKAKAKKEQLAMEAETEVESFEAEEVDDVE